MKCGQESGSAELLMHDGQGRVFQSPWNRLFRIGSAKDWQAGAMCDEAGESGRKGRCGELIHSKRLHHILHICGESCGVGGFRTMRQEAGFGKREKCFDFLRQRLFRLNWNMSRARRQYETLERTGG